MELKNGINLQVEDLRGVITHNDLDGILSALAVHNYLNMSIIGVFELHHSRKYHSKLIVSEKVKHNVSEYLYVDLALKSEKIVSIDHHGTIADVYKTNNNIINANRYYSKSYDMLQNGAVKYKNSTGCIHYILHLLGVDIESFSDEQKILLCLADGLHSVFNTYRDNCLRWLNMLGMDVLIHTLKHTTPSQFDNMREAIGSGSSSYFNYDEVSKQFLWGNKTTLQSTIENICSIMNWKTPIIPKMKMMYMFENFERFATRSLIEEIMLDGNVFSLCVNSNDRKMYYSRYESEIHLPH